LFRTGDIGIQHVLQFLLVGLTFFLRVRFLRNPSELKSIKNISLLRQQMEAQVAAQQLAQAAAQQAVLGCRSPVSVFKHNVLRWQMEAQAVAFWLSFPGKFLFTHNAQS
jgi:hypothetical protein